jgi:hypothetical protein
MEHFLWLEDYAISAYHDKIFYLNGFIIFVVIVIFFYVAKKNLYKYLEWGMAMIIGWKFINAIIEFYEDYKRFKRNYYLMNDHYNLSKYIVKQKYYKKKDLKLYFIFKKCNFQINKFYWNTQNNNCRYYYTSTDDEKETLENILKTTEIKSFRSRLIDKFFETCFISYVLNEKIDFMSCLSNGEEVKLNNLTIQSQDYFILNKIAVTPDFVIKNDNNDIWVVDAYNGSSEKEVKRKYQKYASHFNTKNVFVFCSNVTGSEQFVCSTDCLNLFKLKTISNNIVEEVDAIQCDSIAININEINEKYYKAYQDFSNEVYYWQTCEKQKKIIQIFNNIVV